jgi:hypothetical protein
MRDMVRKWLVVEFGLSANGAIGEDDFVSGLRKLATPMHSQTKMMLNHHGNKGHILHVYEQRS